MTSARALIICTRPQDYAPSRVYAAASYLETLANARASQDGASLPAAGQALAAGTKAGG